MVDIQFSMNLFFKLIFKIVDTPQVLCTLKVQPMCYFTMNYKKHDIILC